MIPTRKPYRPRSDREYKGIPDKDLPIRYQPRENCYIGIATPREDVPEYRREPKPEHNWAWPKARQSDDEAADD